MNPWKLQAIPADIKVAKIDKPMWTYYTIKSLDMQLITVRIGLMRELGSFIGISGRAIFLSRYITEVVREMYFCFIWINVINNHSNRSMDFDQ